jgi:hypothetical protein
MITRYNGFLLERLKFEVLSILEGNIFSTTDFMLKIKSLIKQPGKVGEIAHNLLDIIESHQWFPDSKIKQNYFDLVDSEDMVGFINQSKVKNVIDDVYDNPELPFTMPGRGEIKIGKVVNYLCSLRGISVNDSDREAFVNAWKASTEVSTIQFKLVSGEEIAKYYDEAKYYNSNGTLGSSCMKDEGKRTFKIYTENPSKVKLLIYVDSDDKIHGRALVWKVKKSPCESKYFMDRVYTNRDSDVNRFKDFANNEGWFYKKLVSSHDNDNVCFIYKGQEVYGEVKLKLDGNFNTYPYVDTMCYLSKDKDSLSNLSDKRCYILHDVYGDRERCECCDGDVILQWSGHKELCSDCASGHQVLKKMGIETKWNKKVD